MVDYRRLILNDKLFLIENRWFEELILVNFPLNNPKCFYCKVGLLQFEASFRQSPSGKGSVVQKHLSKATELNWMTIFYEELWRCSKCLSIHRSLFRTLSATLSFSLLPWCGSVNKTSWKMVHCFTSPTESQHFTEQGAWVSLFCYTSMLNGKVISSLVC